jgi:hypothetical protein
MSSFWLDQSTDIRYTVNRAFDYGDVQYTSAGATPETFASLGFVEVQIQQRPDDAFYFVSGPDDTGAYTATPRDHVELVESYVIQESDTANSILAGSDWMVTRKEEIGTPIPPEYVTFRSEVRNTCGLRQQAEMETTTTQQLEALVKAPAFIPDPNDPSKEIPNPDPHLAPWPEDPMTVEQEARRAKRAAAAVQP